MARSIIQAAIDGLPEPHAEIWLASRNQVRRTVARRYLLGEPPSGLVVILAARGTGLATIFETEIPECVVACATDSRPTLIVLDAPRAAMFLDRLPGARAYAAARNIDDFVLITAPRHKAPGISLVRLIDTSRLQ